MTPTVARFVEVAFGQILERLGPALPTAYEQSSATMLAALLVSVGEEFERAAARRVEENAALRKLFEEASGVVLEPRLRDRLVEAAAGADEDLRVSALDSSNAELRGLLIELHAYVEEQDSEVARRIEAAIWRELVASTERRRLSIGPF